MVRFGKHLNQKKRPAFNIVTDNIPTAIYLFDFPTSSEKFAPKLRTILIQSQPVVHVRWNPVRKGSLTLCCGTQSVYIWSDEWHSESDSDQEEMAECIGVPASMFYTFYLHLMPMRVPQRNLRLKIFAGPLMVRVLF